MPVPPLRPVNASNKPVTGRTGKALLYIERTAFPTLTWQESLLARRLPRIAKLTFL
jgi:hypothetical protein